MNKGAAADIMLFDCQKISFTFQALSDFLAVNSGRNIGSESAMCHCWVQSEIPSVGKSRAQEKILNKIVIS